MVVDDNKMSRSLIGYYLKNLGCEVTEVENGAHSLALLQMKKFDLVVLDWNMPILNGHQTLLQGEELLRSVGNNQLSLPVMIYTNTSLNELDIPRSHYFKVKALISKRLRPFQQMKRIKQILQTLFSINGFIKDEKLTSDRR